MVESTSHGRSLGVRALTPVLQRRKEGKEPVRELERGREAREMRKTEHGLFQRDKLVLLFL